MLKAFMRFFGTKNYTRAGFIVWDSAIPQYEFGVAGSICFVNKSDEQIREILQKKYGGKLDVFIITARWTK